MSLTPQRRARINWPRAISLITCVTAGFAAIAMYAAIPDEVRSYTSIETALFIVCVLALMYPVSQLIHWSIHRGVTLLHDQPVPVAPADHPGGLTHAGTASPVVPTPIHHRTKFRLTVKAIGIFLTAVWLPVSGWMIAIYIRNTMSGWAVFSWVEMALFIAAPLGGLVIGLYLFFGGELLIRLAVPRERVGCPACGYDTSTVTGTQCPECGVTIRRTDDAAGPNGSPATDGGELGTATRTPAETQEA